VDANYVLAWPLNRRHYLNAETDMPILVSPATDPAPMLPEPEEASTWTEVGRPPRAPRRATKRLPRPPRARPAPLDAAAVEARALAMAALKHGSACAHLRLGRLFGVSPKTVRHHLARVGPGPAPACVAAARAALLATGARGSTADERTAAVAWLEATVRNDGGFAIAGHLADERVVDTAPCEPAVSLTTRPLEPSMLATLQQLHQRLRRRGLVVSALVATACQGAMAEALGELAEDVVALATNAEDVLQQVWPLRASE
jgi:hypothetical protein